jgi:peptidoglycan/LPS O-acetylase OafA/YrhL
MWRRFRRIYPPYLISILFFVVTRLIRDRMVATTDATAFDPSFRDWAMNSTLTQWLALVYDPAGWPHVNSTLFVSVYWSLCYEEQFYLVVGLIAFCLGRSQGLVYAVLGVFALSWILAYPHTCYGWFIEYWPMFFVGCIVYFRLCVAKATWCRRSIDVAMILGATSALIAANAVVSGNDFGHSWSGWNGSASARNSLGDLFLALLFGIALVALRPLDNYYKESRWLSRPLGWLGAISYSLYLVHNFNLRITEWASKFLFGLLGLASWEPGIAFMQVVALILVGACFWFFAERPFLNRPVTNT